MLGATAPAKSKRERERDRVPVYEVGQSVSFAIYFGYGYTSSKGVIVECLGGGEYVASCENGSRFVVRVSKNGELASGGAN